MSEGVHVSRATVREFERKGLHALVPYARELRQRQPWWRRWFR